MANVHNVLCHRQAASSSSAAAEFGQDGAESHAEQLAEIQEDKAAKEATIASLLHGLAGLPGPGPSEEPPQLPQCLENVTRMQVHTSLLPSCRRSTLAELLSPLKPSLYVGTEVWLEVKPFKHCQACRLPSANECSSQTSIGSIGQATSCLDLAAAWRLSQVAI